MQILAHINYGMRNKAPEEVYLHEFLHTLERNCKEANYNIPALHDNEKYGYIDDKISGLNDWYKDYMEQKIYNPETEEYIGLYDYCYTSQPFNSDNFKYPIKIELYSEPKNIIEEIQTIYKIITHKD